MFQAFKQTTTVQKPPAEASRSKRRGYTLVEIIVAMGIFAILSAGLYSFFLHSLGTVYMTAGKLNVSGDIRKFTSDLSLEARNASYFHMYPSFCDTSAILRDDQSGDMVVFYFLDEAGDVERSIGYFRAAQAGDRGPVRKFDSREHGFDPETLPPLEDQDTFPALIELSLGLADGRLFYNYYDRSIMVRGEIVHRGNLRREATNTYNFTVSPRS